QTLGKSIYPTPVIGILGILEDASRVLKIAFREDGDIIVRLNGSKDSTQGTELATHGEETAREFSSSEYSKTIASIVSGEPPAIDLGAEKRLIDCLVQLAAEGSVQSAHDISEGGIAVTLAESCFAASNLGAHVSLGEASSAEFSLFNERGARCIVSMSPTKLAAVLETARQYGVGAREIGKVHFGSALRIECKGGAVVDSPLGLLRDVWASSLERALTSRR
ncbi:MAG: AIR synthase-related protein, partial [Candidatus Acidiferrum sp.]